MLDKFFNRIQLSNTFFILYFIFIVIISVTTDFTQPLKKSPNILFIAIDDLKPELGCYGNTLIKKPNIDRIGRRGTVFLSNYCQQAVCGPTRASLLAGKRPDYTKVWDLQTRMRDMNPDILTIPQYFISKGYTTAGIGKIYHPTCVDEKFDEPSWSIPFIKTADIKYFSKETGLPLIGAYQLPETKKLIEKYILEARQKGLKGKKANTYAEELIKPSVESADVLDNAYDDGANVLEAKDMLKDLALGKNPFFLAVGIHKPHLPFVSLQKYWDLYNRQDMPLAQFQEHAKNSPEVVYENSSELRKYSDIPPLCSFSDQTKRMGLAVDKQKEMIHGYYAAVSYGDALFGSLLNTLDSLGLSDNTIVVIWGDHGWHLGNHDIWGKHTNFENATRSPLIIYAPGMNPSRISSPTEFVDVFPTLCELAGIPVPQNLDGISLVPVMKNPQAMIKQYSVSQYHRGKKIEGYTVRTKRYRYVEWLSDFKLNHIYNDSKIVGSELYDYEKDPLETVSQIDNPEYQYVQKEMKSYLMEYFASQQNATK